MMQLSDQDFKRLVTFIKSNYGINLEQKRQLIVGRLSNTLISMGYNSFQDYIDHILTKKDPKEIELMLNKLTTNYTYFYREGDHFDYFRDTVLPYLEETKKTGCSVSGVPAVLSVRSLIRSR